MGTAENADLSAASWLWTLGGGAFNNAWHPGILAQLRKLKCPPNTYNMVKDFLSDRTAHVMLGNSLSSKRVTKGCPQGSVSGPTLWNIIIGDLITLLSNETNVKIVVFADDISVNTPWYTQMVKHGLNSINANKNKKKGLKVNLMKH